VPNPKTITVPSLEQQLKRMTEYSGEFKGVDTEKLIEEYIGLYQSIELDECYGMGDLRRQSQIAMELEKRGEDLDYIIYGDGFSD